MTRTIKPKPMYAAPLVITKGGTYSGHWESEDPDVPAVLIRTKEPVLLLSCFLRGRGDLISAAWTAANLTVRGCHGSGLNPNDPARFPGRFLSAEGVVSLLVEDSDFQTTAGIYVNGWMGDPKAVNVPTITVQRNRGRDMEGRFSDGRGGFQDRKYAVQGVQLNNLEHAPRVRVTWNRFDNGPRRSAVEDTISVSHSTGTLDSPMLVDHNLIYGAYPGTPGDSYSGGGIMLGDGGGQYQEASDNTVLETSNYGVAVASGNDMKVLRNTVLGTGTLADGTRCNSTPDAGIYLRDYAQDPNHRPESVIAQGNTVGWGHPNPGDPTNRIDLSIDPAAGRDLGNTLIARGAIDPALLTQAVRSWQARALATGML